MMSDGNDGALPVLQKVNASGNVTPSKFCRILEEFPRIQEELWQQYRHDTEELRRENKLLREEVSGDGGLRSKSALREALSKATVQNATIDVDLWMEERAMIVEDRSAWCGRETADALAFCEKEISRDRIPHENQQSIPSGERERAVNLEENLDVNSVQLVSVGSLAASASTGLSAMSSNVVGSNSVGGSSGRRRKSSFAAKLLGGDRRSTVSIDAVAENSMPKTTCTADGGIVGTLLHEDSFNIISPSGGIVAKSYTTMPESVLSMSSQTTRCMTHENGESGSCFFMKDHWYDRIDLLGTRLRHRLSGSDPGSNHVSGHISTSMQMPQPLMSMRLGAWYKEGKPPSYMIHPNSSKTMFWGGLLFLLLSYDLAMVPMDIGFGLSPTWFTDFMQIISNSFWTLDIVLCFFIGVVHEGRLMMHPRNVIRVYFCTWFPFDFAIIVTEWTTLIIEITGEPKSSSGSPLSFFRALRWSRIVRLLRVVRFIKFRRLRPYTRGLVVVSAEGLSATYGWVRGTLLLLFGVHVITCLWHLVGDSLDNGWVKRSGLEGSSVAHRYAISLHWQLMHVRMDTATSTIMIDTTIEYMTDSLLFLCSFIYAVYYLGLTVNSVITWCNSHAARMVSIARQFTKRHKLSYDLVERMRRFLSANQVEGPFEVLANNQRLKQALPYALQEDINYEIRSPSMKNVCLFRDFQNLYPRLVRNLCQETLEEGVCVEGEVVFGRGDNCQKVIFVASGTYKYSCAEKILLATPRVLPRNSNSGVGFDILVKGNVAAEACLWTHWEHVGDLHALVDSLMISMDTDKFAKTVATFSRPTAHAVKYAKHFTWVANRAIASDVMGWCFSVEDLDSDLHMGGAEDHLAFITHYKIEAGTEATLIQAAIQQLILKDPTNSAADYQSPIFVDSEDLIDLDRLQAHVKGSLALVLLLTPGLLSRPWCLLEIVIAKRHNRPYVPVLVQRPGLEFEIPDEMFYDRLHRDLILAGGIEGRKMLEENGTNMDEVEDAIRAIFRMIALPYSPHKSAVVREAEIHDIFKRCMLLTNEMLAAETRKAFQRERAKSLKRLGSMDVSWSQDDESDTEDEMYTL